MSRQRTRLVSSAPKLRVWVPSRRADPSWLHGDGAWLEHELQPAKWVAELHRYELDAPSAFVHRQGIDVRHSNGNYYMYTHSGSWKDQPFILDVNSDSHNHAWFEYHREVPELLMYGPVADEDFIAVQNGGGPMQLGCPARLSEAQH